VFVYYITFFNKLAVDEELLPLENALTKLLAALGLLPIMFRALVVSGVPGLFLFLLLLNILIITVMAIPAPIYE
jgi:hypothetical protein